MNTVGTYEALFATNPNALSQPQLLKDSYKKASDTRATYKTAGQAVVEMIMLLPLFFVLAAIIVSVVTVVDTHLLMNQTASEGVVLAVEQQNNYTAAYYSFDYVDYNLNAHQINCLDVSQINSNGQIVRSLMGPLATLRVINAQGTETYSETNVRVGSTNTTSLPLGGTLVLNVTCITTLDQVAIPGWPGHLTFTANASTTIGQDRTGVLPPT